MTRIWNERTNAGRVVYNRKKHFFTYKAIYRIIKDATKNDRLPIPSNEEEALELAAKVQTIVDIGDMILDIWINQFVITEVAATAFAAKEFFSKVWIKLLQEKPKQFLVELLKWTRKWQVRE